jgi:hypothetical protein
MMDGHDELPPICRQVWERAVEGGDVMADAALGAHVGSCVSCFRTLAEMRDVPRMAAALRAGAATADVPDRFWDDLAARTTAAASAALRPAERRRPARVVAFLGIAAAAAAALLLVAGRPPVEPGHPASRMAATSGAEEDGAGDDAVDVADLDASALRRLLDRLRARGPANAAALAAGADGPEASDVVFEEDGQVNDELADLDGPALRRLERSLAGAAL